MIPAETWNAQISLLTGFAAASLMVYARVGLLRTLPPPHPHDVQRLHRTARALHIDWPAEQLYPDFIRALDPRKPAEAAMITACARLLRGSGYVALQRRHAGRPDPRRAGLGVRPRHRAAAPPGRPLRRRDLRRAVCRHRRPRLGARRSSPACPTSSRTPAVAPRQYEAMVLDLVEAGVLHDRVGETFDGVVVDVDEKDDHARQDHDPGSGGRGPGDVADALPLGTEAQVRLTQADVALTVGGLRARLIMQKNGSEPISRRFPIPRLNRLTCS